MTDESNPQLTPEKQALQDAQTAFEAIREKLCHALGLPKDSGWRVITEATEMQTSAEKHVASLTTALGLAHKALTECATIACQMIGVRDGVPESASQYVQMLAGRFMAEQEVHENQVREYNASLNQMRAEVKTFQEQDDTEAGTWKAHYVDLAQHVGVPRAVYGSTMAPRVDEVSAFIAALMPSYKFAHQVMELERQMKGIQKTLENLPEARKAPSSHGGCPKCGHPLPEMAAFCPKCGQ